MGEQVGQIIFIMVLIIAIVAVVAVGFGMFTTSNKQANASYTDLSTTMHNLQKSDLLYFDQREVTGSMVKNFMSKSKTSDIAILVGTTRLYGVEPNIVYGESSESDLTGQICQDVTRRLVPFAQMENLKIETSLGTEVSNPYFVNYGAVLNNSIVGLDGGGMGFISPIGSSVGESTEATADTIEVVQKTAKYGDTAEFNQALNFRDNSFHTKLDFGVNTGGSTLRYDSALDIEQDSKTMSIDDTAMFMGYMLKNTSGEEVGVVFVQENF